MLPQNSRGGFEPKVKVLFLAVYDNFTRIAMINQNEKRSES